jgi:tRNA1(Val) A37 N6-methylase TrmN6
MEFRDTSITFHKKLDKKVRSDQGIYFTPKKVRDRLFDALSSLHISPSLILEPSFGTGEILLDAVEKYSVPCVGIERHPDLFASVASPNIETICTDFLTWSDPRSFDLIVGNPPFVGCSQKSPSLTGRSNTYILFLYKCLTEHLSTGGTLAFILPTSLYNSSYYEPMRKYLYQHTTIHVLETLIKPGFKDTTQEAMLLVVQKTPGQGKYFFPYKQLYLSPYATELSELIQGATTMKALGLGVKTGNIVWNQHKDHLSDSGTLLVYSSNVNQGLVYPPLKLPKKQYIHSDKPTLDGPVILVTRGYGNTYQFQYALVEEKGFYAENHLNVIYPKIKGSLCQLERVLASFRDPRFQRYLSLFVGNGALSARELEQIPIY